MHFRPITAALVGLALVSSAHAASIGLSFTPHNDTGALSVLSTTDVVGYPDVAQANWNNLVVTHNANGDVFGSFSGVVDDSGNPTSLTVTVNDLNRAFMVLRNETWGYKNAEHTMRRAYVRQDVSVTISNVPYAVYDVYVYMFHNGAANESIMLTLADGATGAVDSTVYYFRYNGNTPNVLAVDTQPPASGNPTPADTIRFVNNTASSFVIQAGDGSFEPGIAAIQIVAVPEPAAIGLLGVGALMLVRRRRV